MSALGWLAVWLLSTTQGLLVAAVVGTPALWALVGCPVAAAVGIGACLLADRRGR